METAVDGPAAATPAAGLAFGQVVLLGAALTTAGAGFLHLDAAGDHTDHAHIAGFFVAVGVAQLCWAAAVARRHVDRRTVALGLLVNVGVLAVWAVSRTVGLPDLIPDAGGVEEIGWKDAAASGLALASLAAGTFALVMPAAAASAVMPLVTGERVLRGMAAATLAITVPGVLVSHDHGAHGHGDDAAHGHGDTETAALEVHDHAGDPTHAHDSSDLAGELAAEPHLHSEVIEGHPASTADHGHTADTSTATHGSTGAVSTVAAGHAHDDGVAAVAPGHDATATGDGHAHAGTAAPVDHGGHVQAAAVDVGPPMPDPLDGPGTVSTVRFGPFALLPQIPGLEMPHLSPAIPRVLPGELNLLPLVGLPAPCQDCYVLGLQPDLVYADGSAANLDSGPMLHHAVWIDPQREDPVCDRDTLLGQLGHRVFASGNERTAFAAPPGYGMPVAGGLWNGAVELMNMSDQLHLVYVQLTARWVPRRDASIDPVTSVWLDIDSCGDSSVDIPAGVTDVSSDWTSNLTGRIVTAGGHLHDGGEWLGLTNATNGQHVCTSVAGYGAKPAYLGSLDSMSGCLWDALAVVRAGDVLRLNAHYNTTAPQLGVMGIMVLFVHETTDLAVSAPSPYPSEPPPDREPGAGHQH